MLDDRHTMSRSCPFLVGPLVQGTVNVRQLLRPEPTSRHMQLVFRSQMRGNVNITEDSNLTPTRMESKPVAYWV